MNELISQWIDRKMTFIVVHVMVVSFLLLLALIHPREKYQELLLSDPPFAQALLRGFLRQMSYECRELSRLVA